ncbi:helix-turn-helix transcriptional regulator [Sphaerisporangium sp. TRM90804]|uniref:helix-turn-helix domain-containing protein n=1 Tax=Sphaerisporangium sp. TRM90804 TaxID=3031113 RepID=UPI002446DD0B|nr:helix-turn-helix transcriptional regulator [Sphaerisporangium sp. TRM90804]MDH2425345.1 helix-turn-helix transcriptional regulator [Sphaerisporangium sp. TRM90804]
MSPRKELDPNESPRALFAAELRRYRHAARLSQKALASRMGYSDSLVAMVETLTRSPTDDFAKACDKALCLDGTMYGLYVATRWDKAQAHLRPWLVEEEEAHVLRSWEPSIVPGLLQTEAYARAMFMTAPGLTSEQVEERLAGRMRRQSILHRADAPLVTFVIDEGVIRRRVGSAEIMREQLGFLLDVAQHRNVTLQIVLHDAGEHCGLAGGFIVAERNGSVFAAYTDAQPNGRTIDDRRVIAELAARYDAIRSEALPFKQSLRLIEEVVNQSG